MLCMLKERYRLERGDITRVSADAIVNAANSSLLGGGGVDGAIHSAAGPELLAECRKIGGCPTGEVRMTPGFRLMAHYVFHTVGPVWRGGDHGEEGLLASCYINCLNLASRMRLGTIAFPSISTGTYGFPIEKAAEIAMGEICAFAKNHDSPHLVIMVLFSDRDLAAYRNAMEGLKGPKTPELKDV
jgi:O-acetyl-ADP-ribose deacetylase (regulator of RNase III)